MGDRVVVPFTIACGECFFCKKTLYSLLRHVEPERRSSPPRRWANRRPACSATRICSAAIAGGQAEYLRVPYADVGPHQDRVRDLTDEQVLFLSDIFPTGYMAAENCEIEQGDTVAVWGCGPVGQFAIKSAWMFGAGRVIAIDRVPERLAMAETHGKAETIDFDEAKRSTSACRR